MAQATVRRAWITGEEFNRERRRLIDAGLYHAGSPEYRDLRRRVAERNAHLFRTYGRPLMREHYGKWVAISAEGETTLADSESAALRSGVERFGAGNFCLARLHETRGPRLLSPRSA